MNPTVNPQGKPDGARGIRFSRGEAAPDARSLADTEKSPEISPESAAGVSPESSAELPKGTAAESSPGTSTGATGAPSAQPGAESTSERSGQEPGSALRLLRHCVWPDLPVRYDRGLRVAVRFVLENFAVHGVVLSGTVLEGAPDARSDLDLYVIHAQPQRRRLQRWFNGIPTEIFVNPVSSIRNYFEMERDRPSTANMLAHGHVIYAQDPVVGELRNEAQEWLARVPALSADELRQWRYLIVDQLDNAKDTVSRDPAVSQMLLGRAVQGMVHYAFLAAGRHVPRDKAMLSALGELDRDAADTVRRFYLAVDPDARLALADAVAMRIIGVNGFFEWDSPWEAVEEPPDEVPEEPPRPDTPATRSRLRPLAGRR